MATTPTTNAPAPKPKRKLTAEEQALLQEAKDKEAEKAAGAAYDKAMPAPYKNGGSVSSRADGIAAKGKTRGKIC
jgi:hypothetical protein